MAYFEPYIDESGLHIPTFIDIRDDMVEQARRIFGQDVYLEPDSQDYELLSINALRISHGFDLARVIYNNRSPKTAVGSALDGLVKINGMQRKAATYSTCILTCTGTPGLELYNAQAVDTLGRIWTMPQLIFGPDGRAEVLSTVNVLGQITARPGDISQIKNPTQGWFSVTNEVPAAPGLPTEYDYELKDRQTKSTMLPSRSLLEGTEGGILSIEGVVRERVYENDTNQVDALGLPPHSITCVVEGATNEAIAEQIWLRKGIGAYTNGDVEVFVSDRYGETSIIRFFRPTFVNIDVTVNIIKSTGYSSDIPALIQQNITNFLNNAVIGEPVRYSSVWQAALLAIDDIKNPNYAIRGITLAKEGQAQTTADIDMAFNEVSYAANIVVNEVT